jgi:MFS family permease
MLWSTRANGSLLHPAQEAGVGGRFRLRRLHHSRKLILAAPFFVDLRPLRRFPAFRRLWVGYGLRQFGTWVTVTTVIYQVYSITHSNLDVGLISVAQVVPGVITPIFGGALVDAVDRRRLLVITAVLMAFSTVGLALNTLGDHPALWALYVCSAAAWALSGIDTPTRTAVLITLVDRESYIAANVLRQALAQLGQVAGPAIAGVLIATFSHDLAIVYWIDVASTFAALQSVVRLPPLGSAGNRVSLQAVAEGFRYLKRMQVIQACFITDINATLLGLPTSLYPYMAEVHFHGGAKAFGLLTASPGIGALVGATVSGWTQQVRYQGRAVLIAVVVWGFAIAAFGFAPSLTLGVILLAIAGWGNAVSATMRNTILQAETPDRLRGRITSMQNISVQIGRLGNAESGFVAALSNVQVSIVSGGLGCVIGVLVIARFMPRYARYRLDESNLAEPEHWSGD